METEDAGRHKSVLRSPSLWIGLSLWLIAAIVWRVDAARPSRTIAQSIPVPAASTNAYWAGYVATGGGPYTAVQASWTVPAISCSPRTLQSATAYVWIGEGGYLQGFLSPLIQAGTGSDCLSRLPRYHAFFEWYPGIYATDFPIEIRPGDTVTARLEETQPDYWVLTFHDETNGVRSTTAVPYHVDPGSADFIVERPTVCSALTCQQVALGKFQPIVFHDVQARTAGETDLASVPAAIPIALVDPATDRALAVPARLKPNDGSFSVMWRRDS